MSTRERETEVGPAAKLRPLPANLLVWIAAGSFLILALPVVFKSGPLADDFLSCVRAHDIGLSAFLSDSIGELGAVRPVRLIEFAFIYWGCPSLPFGILILVPLSLTIVVAFLLRRLLVELEIARPWPEVGAALWFWQPLGTEAALWPSALHVPLGLGLALAAALFFLRRRLWWGAVASIGACLSVEQAIFALPVVAFLVTPRDRRRAATVIAASVVAGVLMLYSLWPGENPRALLSLGDRIQAVVSDAGYFLRLPAIGLGLHSIPLAVWWAFPVSLAVIAGGAWLGWRTVPRFLSGHEASRDATRWARLLLWFVALAFLVNLPLAVTVPHEQSPRTFTPTWLLICAFGACAGAKVAWRRSSLLGAVAGVWVTGALLSLTLSVFVRIATVDFTEDSSALIARSVPEGGIAAICDVRRTVVSPAPAGSFAIHELIYPWAARAALDYYTGRDALIRRSGTELWGRSCPNEEGADAVLDFDDLVERARTSDT
jgi:hypothetical protein